VEINLGSTSGGIVQKEKKSCAEHSWRNQLNMLQETIHYSFIKFCINCFSFWYEFNAQYALKSQKNYQHGLVAGLLEFQFLCPRDFWYEFYVHYALKSKTKIINMVLLWDFWNFSFFAQGNV
jgi:hypothetical protein